MTSYNTMTTLCSTVHKSLLLLQHNTDLGQKRDHYLHIWSTQQVILETGYKRLQLILTTAADRDHGDGNVNIYHHQHAAHTV